MGISVYPPATGGAKVKRTDLITATGPWVAPSGVTYAIAHMVAGGGGGAGQDATGNYGGTSSAFSFDHLGGRGGAASRMREQGGSSSAQANTGQGGSGRGGRDTSYAETLSGDGGDSIKKAVGAVVVPGTTYTITVGAGGAGAGGNGGSGFIEIEYYVDA